MVVSELSPSAFVEIDFIVDEIEEDLRNKEDLDSGVCWVIFTDGLIADKFGVVYASAVTQRANNNIGGLNFIIACVSLQFVCWRNMEVYRTNNYFLMYAKVCLFDRPWKD